MADVMILLGSDTDLSAGEQTRQRLNALGASCALHVASAHRTPQHLHDLVAGSEAKVFICAAGGAAHLAGAVAAVTTRPVIGIPLATGALGGVDALYSTVNMPPGMPVATVSVGPWGIENAAVLALQILAVGDDALAGRLAELRAEQRDKLLDKDAALQDRLGGDAVEEPADDA